MNTLSPEFYLVVVAAITVLSTARLARLATIDKFPPIKKIRDWYETKTDGSDWQWLTMCAFCMAPWMAVLVFGSGLAVGVYDTPQHATLGTLIWFIFNGWLAISYLSGTYVARDGATGEDD